MGAVAPSSAGPTAQGRHPARLRIADRRSAARPRRLAGFRNGFSFGGNFVESFNGVDVAVSGRYDFADDEASGSDPSLWIVGLNLGFAGFTIGGSYADTDHQDANMGRSFDAGISYETGLWGMSFTYFDGQSEGLPGGDEDEYQAYEGAIAYALGPGVTAVGSVSFQNLGPSRIWPESGGRHRPVDGNLSGRRRLQAGFLTPRKALGRAPLAGTAGCAVR